MKFPRAMLLVAAILLIDPMRGQLSLHSIAQAAPTQTSISDPAYRLVLNRTSFPRTAFYVYRDQDDGANHGFPSGFFGATDHISLDAGCIDEPAASNGCSTDASRLDRGRGTVLRISIAPLAAQTFAGVNIEEPENWGVLQTGLGYDLRGANSIVFDVRSPDSARFQFGVGQCVADFIAVTPTWTTKTIPLSSLHPAPGQLTTCPPPLDAVHVLFTAVTTSTNAPSGGTVLLDNIHFEPVPTVRQTAIGFPLSTQTFGVVPVLNVAPGRVPVPSDQVLRNLTTIYESALAESALLARGTPADLDNARTIADTFDYVLHHDNSGDPLPTTTVGTSVFVAAHNGYENGDIALFNDQSFPKNGKAGQVRLAGFSASTTLCGPSGFCLVLDGATGGNNAFAILALVGAFEQFQDIRYLDDARVIANWIIANLTDPATTGFGGYFVGYPDEGKPKTLIAGKSVENNADIFAALAALASIETQLGNLTAAAKWSAAANVAGDFVMQMFDAANGRFNAGTVPVGTVASAGICPTGLQKGNDVINTCDFIDADTFTVLALAASPRYQTQIDWRLPVRYALNTFAQSVTAAGHTFNGFDIVKSPTAGPNGIAWEFTAQMAAVMRFVDQLTGQSEFEAPAAAAMAQIATAQTQAPFTDGQGLVASTLQDGDTLPPIEQCLSTPFQCIPERVGLAASAWAIFAEKSVNAFTPLPLFKLTVAPGSKDTVTVPAGQNAAYDLSLTSLGTFSGPVSFACAGAPVGAQCTVAPATINLVGTAPQGLTVTVTTTARTVAGAQIVGPESGAPWHSVFYAGLAIIGILSIGVRSSKDRRSLVQLVALGVLVCSLLMITQACGGGGGTSPPSPTPPLVNPNGTPAGPYSLTVAANGGFSTASVNLNLTVQ